MILNNKLFIATLSIILVLGAIGTYVWVNSFTNPGSRIIYFSEPIYANDTITVTVWNSTNPAISDIYVGFDKNDGGGAIHLDSYTRCVNNLSNNISVDWIAYFDNDSDGAISINDTFIISTHIFKIQIIQSQYRTDGYFNIGFSNEGMDLYLAMINIDATKV